MSGQAAPPPQPAFNPGTPPPPVTATTPTPAPQAPQTIAQMSAAAGQNQPKQLKSLIGQ